jgi:hypothetical protein
MNTNEEVMLDYSEILLNIQKTHRECHDAMLKRNWNYASIMSKMIQTQAAELQKFCDERMQDGNVG